MAYSIFSFVYPLHVLLHILFPSEPLQELSSAILQRAREQEERDEPGESDDVATGAASPSNPLGCGVGEYGWGGAGHTKYFAAPNDGDLLVLFFTQVQVDPRTGQTTQELRSLVYSSVLEKE